MVKSQNDHLTKNKISYGLNRHVFLATFLHPQNVHTLFDCAIYNIHFLNLKKQYYHFDLAKYIRICN